MNFKEWLTVLIALVWFVGATVIALANVGGSWDSKELAAWLALVGWMWVKRRRDS